MFKKKILSVFTEASSSVILDPEKSLARWRLEAGRTRARASSLTTEVREAEGAVRTIERTIGEQMDQGLAADMQGLHRAKDRAESLRCALTVAVSKDQAAQTALADAKLQAQIDAEYHSLVHVKSVALEVDALLLDTQRLIEGKLIPAIEACRSASTSGIHQNYLVALTQGFELHFMKAARALLPRGRAHAVLLGEKKYSDEIPDPETARTRKRG